MGALINETKRSLKEVLELLKQKIDETIIEDRSIGISIETDFMNCLNRLYVEDYEVTNTQIYLSYDNLDINILFNENTEIVYEDEEEHFTITHNGASILLYV